MRRSLPRSAAHGSPCQDIHANTGIGSRVLCPKSCARTTAPRTKNRLLAGGFFDGETQTSNRGHHIFRNAADGQKSLHQRQFCAAMDSSTKSANSATSSSIRGNEMHFIAKWDSRLSAWGSSRGDRTRDRIEHASGPCEVNANRLLHAATHAGLGEKEARATITSGLNAGARHPRPLRHAKRATLT